MEIENWRDFKRPCKTDFVEQEPLEHFWNPCSISIFFVAVVGSPLGTANQNPDGGFNVKTGSMTSPPAKYSCNSGIIFVQDVSNFPSLRPPSRVGNSAPLHILNMPHQADGRHVSHASKWPKMCGRSWRKPWPGCPIKPIGSQKKPCDPAQ